MLSLAARCACISPLILIVSCVGWVLASSFTQRLRLTDLPKPTQLVMWQSWDFSWVCLPPKAGLALKHSPLLPPPPLPAANLQSPYAQVPCIPLCPRLDKKMVRRKQGSQYVLDPCTPASLGPDIHSLFFQSGSQGSRWVPKRQELWPRPIHLLHKALA